MLVCSLLVGQTRTDMERDRENIDEYKKGETNRWRDRETEAPRDRETARQRDRIRTCPVHFPIRGSQGPQKIKES